MCKCFSGKHWPTLYCGSDKYGHPVLMERIAKMNVEAIVSAEEEDVLRMRSLLMEAVSYICKNNSEGREYVSISPCPFVYLPLMYMYLLS